MIQTALHFPFDAWKFRKANLTTRGGIYGARKGTSREKNLSSVH